MALDPTLAAALLPKLTAYLAEQRWASMGVADLDSGYTLLTTDEKQVILNSLLNGDDGAKSLIKTKLDGPVQTWAAQQAQAYINANSIPLDVIAAAF